MKKKKKTLRCILCAGQNTITLLDGIPEKRVLGNQEKNLHLGGKRAPRTSSYIQKILNGGEVGRAGSFLEGHPTNVGTGIRVSTALCGPRGGPGQVGAFITLQPGEWGEKRAS